MSVLSTKQIHGVLVEAGLEVATSDTKNIEKLLKLHSLSPGDVIEAISNIVHGGDNSNVKLRAAEISAKLNGMLANNEGVAIPIVNIIINGEVGNINPICIPRELEGLG